LRRGRCLARKHNRSFAFDKLRVRMTIHKVMTIKINVYGIPRQRLALIPRGVRSTVPAESAPRGDR
jgi:hypothetical protein